MILLINGEPLRQERVKKQWHQSVCVLGMVLDIMVDGTLFFQIHMFLPPE